MVITSPPAMRKKLSNKELAEKYLNEGRAPAGHFQISGDPDIDRIILDDPAAHSALEAILTPEQKVKINTLGPRGELTTDDPLVDAFIWYQHKDEVEKRIAATNAAIVAGRKREHRKIKRRRIVKRGGLGAVALVFVAAAAYAIYERFQPASCDESYQRALTQADYDNNSELALLLNKIKPVNVTGDSGQVLCKAYLWTDFTDMDWRPYLNPYVILFPGQIPSRLPFQDPHLDPNILRHLARQQYKIARLENSIQPRERYLMAPVDLKENYLPAAKTLMALRAGTKVDIWDTYNPLALPAIQVRVIEKGESKIGWIPETAVEPVYSRPVRPFQLGQETEPQARPN